jgi:hypothetical protein
MNSLRRISGIGPVKLEKYGRQLLEVIGEEGGGSDNGENYESSDNSN